MYQRYLSLFAGFALLLLVGLGAYWQAEGRTTQQIVIGSNLDDGYTHNFQAREQSSFLGNVPFRWSKPSARLRFWEPETSGSTRLSLHMIAPAAPGFTQQITLTRGPAMLGSFPVSPELRQYQMLVPPSAPGDLVVEFRSLTFPGPESRPLGIVFTGAAVADLHTSSWVDMLGEIGHMPFLPLTLLAIGGMAFWVGGRYRSALLLALPALALAALALLDTLFPNSRLLLATYLLCVALVCLLALAGVALLRRFPQLNPTTDRAGQRWIVLAFLVAMAFTFSPSMRSDGVGYYVYLRSLTMDGDLYFQNDYNRLWPNYHPTDIIDTPTGYTGNPWAVGPAFWWSPFYGVAHVVVLAGQALGAPWQADGYDEHYIALITLASALAGLGALLICYRIIRRWVSPSIATLAILTLLFGTNLLYYMTRRGCYAHALGALLSSFFVLAWLRLEDQPSMRRWMMLGIAAGLMLQTYWVSGLTFTLALCTFVRLFLAAVRGPASQRGQKICELVLGAGAAGIIAILIFVPQMVAWQILYGSPITVPQGSGFVAPGSSRILAMIAGEPYGLLWWTPGMLAGFAGLLLLWRRSAWLTACLLVAMLLYFWYNSTIRDWHGSGGFGLRRLSLLSPWCAIGLALLYDRLARRHPAIPIGFSALVSGWTLMLLVRLDHDLIPFEAEELMGRPFVELLLSRNALPLWDVPRLLLGSYYADQIRDIGNPLTALWLAVLVVITGLGAFGVWWVLRMRSPEPRTENRELRTKTQI